MFHFFIQRQCEGQQMLRVEQTHIVWQGGVLPQNARHCCMIGGLVVADGAVNSRASGRKMQRLCQTLFSHGTPDGSPGDGGC
jgi:hypothetical protein